MKIKSKKLLIVSGDPNINDIELKLPIIKYFVENIGNVSVWLPYFNEPNSKAQKIYIKLLKKMKVEIIIKKEFQEKFDINYFSFFNFLNNKFSFFKKIFMTESHWISKFILVKYLRKFILNKKISEKVKSYDYIFLCQYPEISKQITLETIHKVAIKAKAKLYGIPDACHVKWNSNKITKYDYALLSSKNHIVDFKLHNSELPYLVFGANHLKKEWLEYFKYEYEEDFFPNYSKKNNLLIILGKPDHFFWNGIDQEKLILDTFIKIFKTNYFVLIKPHPRDNLIRLKKILNKINYIANDKYLIIDDPINIAMNYVKHVVSFPSYGAIGPQSINKVPFLFWPLNGDYLNAIMNKKLNEPFKKSWIKKNFKNEVVTIFDDFCFSINKIDKIINHDNNIVYDKNLSNIKKENFYEYYSIKKTSDSELRKIFEL